MENSDKIVEKFNYKKYSKLLIDGGIVGILLSMLFVFLFTNLKGGRNEYDPPSPWWFDHSFLLTSYYFINSCLLIYSGKLLEKKKKMGIYYFLVAIISIFSSLLIFSQGQNLFVFTIVLALPFIPFNLGVVYFFYSIGLNLFFLKKWFDFFNKLKN